MRGPLIELISTSVQTHAKARLVHVKMGVAGGFFFIPVGAKDVDKAESRYSNNLVRSS